MYQSTIRAQPCFSWMNHFPMKCLLSNHSVSPRDLPKEARQLNKTVVNGPTLWAVPLTNLLIFTYNRFIIWYSVTLGRTPCLEMVTAQLSDIADFLPSRASASDLGANNYLRTMSFCSPTTTRHCPKDDGGQQSELWRICSTRRAALDQGRRGKLGNPLVNRKCRAR